MRRDASSSEFRSDRPATREALTAPAFDGFELPHTESRRFCTLTSYGGEFPTSPASRAIVANGFGEYSRSRSRQLRSRRPRNSRTSRTSQGGAIRPTRRRPHLVRPESRNLRSQPEMTAGVPTSSSRRSNPANTTRSFELRQADGRAQRAISCATRSIECWTMHRPVSPRCAHRRRCPDTSDHGTLNYCDPQSHSRILLTRLTSCRSCLLSQAKSPLAARCRLSPTLLTMMGLPAREMTVGRRISLSKRLTFAPRVSLSHSHCPDFGLARRPRLAGAATPAPKRRAPVICGI